MSAKKVSTILIAFMALSWIFAAAAFADPPSRSSPPTDAVTATGGLSLYGTPKYPPDFRNLDYVNPDAPKGGEIRYAAIGSFDNLNPFILKGDPAEGASMVFDTLMAQAADEPFSEYGLLAKSATLSADRLSVTFILRPQARFNDGTKVTPDDVVWTFNTLNTKAHPSFHSYYADVAKVETVGTDGVKFTFANAQNRQLPLIIGQMPVLPAHAWRGKDFSETTLTPLVGSGPYRVKSVDPGRGIVYERVKDWWGKDLPINRGRFNFDTIRYDYYRDSTIAIEALMAGRYDFRAEYIAKAWATAYDAPAVREGFIKKQEIENHNPQGMQAFVYNTRRSVFADPRVREALAYALDFEWSNAHFAYNSYTRSRSYFDNSELAATGLPSAAEMKILAPYRGKVPDEVFTTEYQPPKTDGTGDIRANLKTALDLLKEAGWDIRDKTLTNMKTGQPFTFEILADDPAFERWIEPFMRNLERIGIQTRFRVVDPAQYINRVRQFDFDMTMTVFPQSLTPGPELRDYWTSAMADQPGSRNLAGIKDPVVDALVDQVIAATDFDDLVAHCKALDRVLQWGFYVIPQWHISTYRIAYWDKFGQPKTPPKYALGVEDTWWVDPAKDVLIAKKQGDAANAAGAATGR